MRADGIKKMNRSGVTLLELLAVIMIAGLLAAVSIPAFNSLLKGTAVNTAATSLTDTLALARQVAIANRLLCHVEFVDEATLEEQAEGIRDNSYRVYYVDRNGEEITVRDWKLLPRFVEFERGVDRNGKELYYDLREVLFKPTGGAAAYDPQDNYIGDWEYRFRVVHSEAGTRKNGKAVQVSVFKISGKAKAEAVKAAG